MNRILISGTGSGCGKTTVSSALLRALQRRGLDICAFKCGPDYIDPMFHQAALGLPSYNLDLYFLSEQHVKDLLAQHLLPQKMGVIEGVMGFYDGLSGTEDTASAAHLARATQTPALLVVRPKGQSLSLAAMLQGFMQFAPNSIAGVVFNGISAGMYPFYQRIVAKIGLKSYGFLPHIPQSELADRHLGLVTAAEIQDLQNKLDRLADAAEQFLDLDGLLALASSAPDLQTNFRAYAPVSSEPVRIAIAKDAAFCFYYQDNLDILEQMGAQLIPFSPLISKTLPSDIDGCYLGGGYPELYAAELAKNKEFREILNMQIAHGLPVIAECGGFMYLQERIQTDEGDFPMVGVFPGTSKLSSRLQNFGYAEMTAQTEGILCAKGDKLRIHEFHYAQSQHSGTDFSIMKPNGKQWAGTFHTKTIYAGYPHLYFRAYPQVAERFLKTCIEMRTKR